jgi:hypothetical protein
MILNSSDVVSISSWLSFWEFAEYASEAAVGLGCVGEYIAEYTKWRTEDDRHILGRRSLILLILGIGFGLVSLIQTNALSGRVIESLGQQAARAAEKVQIASKVSDSAFKKAESAALFAGIAETKSKDVAKRTAEIEKSLEKTSGILALLTSLSEARHIPDTKPLIQKLRELKELKGKPMIVESYAPDAWGYSLCESLYFSVHAAEMNASDRCGTIPFPTNTPVFTGLGVWGPDQSLAEKLGETISRSGRLGTASGLGPPGNTYTILIGVQNPFWIGQ